MDQDKIIVCTAISSRHLVALPPGVASFMQETLKFIQVIGSSLRLLCMRLFLGSGY